MVFLGGFLIAIILMVFGMPTLILGIAGLLPTVLVLLINPNPRSDILSCVGYMNACGVLLELGDLWRNSHTLPYVIKLLQEPFTWILMYGTAAIGWAAYLIFPTVIASFNFLYSEYRIQKWRKKQAKLVEEWGEEVK